MRMVLPWEYSLKKYTASIVHKCISKQMYQYGNGNEQPFKLWYKVQKQWTFRSWYIEVTFKLSSVLTYVVASLNHGTRLCMFRHVSMAVILTAQWITLFWDTCLREIVISPLKTNIVKRFHYQKNCVVLVKLYVFEKCLSIEWRAFIWDRCRKKLKTWYTGIQELLVGVNYFRFTGCKLFHSN